MFWNLILNIEENITYHSVIYDRTLQIVHILSLFQRVSLSSTFIGMYLGDEVTQAALTNFSQCTLNPPLSHRSLLVEFKYTLFENLS
jgi:hypothetical protein